MKTVENEDVQIIEHGYLNNIQGPDFLESKIKINDQFWAGNIEIHIRSSDWPRHGHDKDDAFKTVILHVVWENDKNIEYSNNRKVPTIELRNRIFPYVLSNYLKLSRSKKEIPCEIGMKRVYHEVKEKHLNRMGKVRLERKSNELIEFLQENNWDWESSLKQLIAKNIGGNGNSNGFIQLGKLIPIKLILVNRNNILKVEALLFGIAGLLNQDFETSSYLNSLVDEYNYFKIKYPIYEMNPSVWKFGKIRPAAFPTIRISQFANLISKQENLFSKIMSSNNLKELREIVSARASIFWDNHYHFNRPSKNYPKQLGNSTIDSLIINSVLPLMNLYGEIRDKPNLKKLSLDILFDIPPENNHIIREFKLIGLEPNNALHTQGILETKTLCAKKSCLKCDIGNWIITN